MKFMFNQKVAAEDSSENVEVAKPKPSFIDFQNNYFSKLRNSETEEKQKDQKEESN